MNTRWLGYVVACAGAAASPLFQQSARAADLAAAEPTEYVKICDAFGAGYFFIPGSSDTCLRISGYVRAYIQYQGRNTVNDQTRGAAFSAGGAGAGRLGGYAEIAAPILVNPVSPTNGATLTGTAVGPAAGAAPVANPASYALYGVNNINQLAAAGPNFVLRGNSELRDQYVSGVRALLRFDARSKTEFGVLRSFFEFGATTNNNGKNGDPVQIRYGFVQFGPITAGVTESFFDYFATATHYNLPGNRFTRPPLFAYTASLGNGLAVTLSAEDSTINEGVGGQNTAIQNGGTAVFSRRSVQLPDGVLNVRWVQDWGVLHVAAAAGQFRFANTACSAALSVTGVCTTNKTGWAVTGAANFKLPFLGKGDNIIFKGTYAEGALGYLGFVTNRGFLGNGVAGFDNTVSTLRGYSFGSYFNHYFTPAVRGSVYGNYTTLSGGPGRNFGSNITLFREGWAIYGALAWTPVRNLEFSVEGFYQNASFDFFGANFGASSRILGNASDYNAGVSFRVERTF